MSDLKLRYGWFERCVRNSPSDSMHCVYCDAVFRVSPALNELVLLKEIAFTVYNKAPRISRSSFSDVHSARILGKPNSSLMQMTAIPGMWKECVPRITGTSLPTEGELDSGLRPGNWDNSWQSSRAETGSVEHGVMPTVFNNETSESTRVSTDDSAGGGFMQGSSSAGSMDIVSSSLLDGSEPEGFGCNNQKIASLHCCYGWTEDWRCRQDTKGLQCVFVQVLHQVCQMISCSCPEVGTAKSRDIVITRIGSFFKLEFQEWQKVIYFVSGNEVKKWPLQLRRYSPDGIQKWDLLTAARDEFSRKNSTFLTQPSVQSSHKSLHFYERCSRTEQYKEAAYGWANSFMLIFLLLGWELKVAAALDHQAIRKVSAL
ncbi:hypothetical protein NE237_000737 [Protea cynaroides]|uniref:Mediator of RNA polymerase II transcription subunit 13 n=1 Tax=Protea cynaroides TaxID=273540 RepID=A0A9Q0KSP6_9MAGN|nr:hypothetical protein NE237_000737 [Protea cynaroides]